MPASEVYEAVPESERFLGAGRFGWVKKVRRKADAEILACKSIRYQDSGVSKAQVLRECALLKQLVHPNVVKLVDVLLQPHKAKIYMEYCQGGSLQDLIKECRESKTKISEQYIWMITFQLASALLLCHHGLRVDKDGRIYSDIHNIHDWNPVIHRDIKPANVLLLNRSETALDSVKLGDFGLGHVLQYDAPPETYAGTREFLPPEINRLGTRAIRWTTQCDIFSLGCTIYTLCNLNTPFDYHMESDSDSFPAIDELYSSDLIKCILSCLSFHSENRPLAVHLFQLSQRHIASIAPTQALVDQESAPSEIKEAMKQSTAVDFASSEATRIIESGDENVPEETTQEISAERSQRRFELNGGPDFGSSTFPALVLPDSSAQAQPAKPISTVIKPAPSPSQDQKFESAKAVIQGVSAALDSKVKLDGWEKANRTTLSKYEQSRSGQTIEPNSLSFDNGRILVPKGTEGLGKNPETLAAPEELAPYRSLQIQDLIDAAKYNTAARVRALLIKGIPLDGTDMRGRTALSHAAEEGNLDVVQELLAIGADPSIRENASGYTALNYAVMNNRSSVASALLRSGRAISESNAQASQQLLSGPKRRLIKKPISRTGLEVNATEESPMPSPIETGLPESCDLAAAGERASFDPTHEPSYEAWRGIISGPHSERKADRPELLYTPSSPPNSTSSDPVQMHGGATADAASLNPPASYKVTGHGHSVSVDSRMQDMYPARYSPPHTSPSPEQSNINDRPESLEYRRLQREDLGITYVVGRASGPKPKVQRPAISPSSRAFAQDPTFGQNSRPKPKGQRIVQAPSPRAFAPEPTFSRRLPLESLPWTPTYDPSQYNDPTLQDTDLAYHDRSYQERTSSIDRYIQSQYNDPMSQAEDIEPDERDFQQFDGSSPDSFDSTGMPTNRFIRPSSSASQAGFDGSSEGSIRPSSSASQHRQVGFTRIRTPPLSTARRLSTTSVDVSYGGFWETQGSGEHGSRPAQNSKLVQRAPLVHLPVAEPPASSSVKSGKPVIPKSWSWWEKYKEG